MGKNYTTFKPSSIQTSTVVNNPSHLFPAGSEVYTIHITLCTVCLTVHIQNKEGDCNRIWILSIYACLDHILIQNGPPGT